jgi:hypothetical protein
MPDRILAHFNFYASFGKRLFAEKRVEIAGAVNDTQNLHGIVTNAIYDHVFAVDGNPGTSPHCGRGGPACGKSPMLRQRSRNSRTKVTARAGLRADLAPEFLYEQVQKARARSAAE